MRLIANVLVAAALLAAPGAAAQVQRTMTNDRCSGSIAVGGTSQIAANGDNSRVWLVVQNPINATEPLFVDFGPNHLASSTLSTQLAPGGSVSFFGGVVPIQQVNVNAATSGHTFICETGR
jgi:hypothetical protein